MWQDFYQRPNSTAQIVWTIIPIPRPNAAGFTSFFQIKSNYMINLTCSEWRLWQKARLDEKEK